MVVAMMMMIMVMMVYAGGTAVCSACLLSWTLCHFSVCRRLLQQLESFSSKASPGMEKLSYPGTPKPDQVADSLTYQLYCRPQQAHITRNAKVSVMLGLFLKVVFIVAFFLAGR